MGRPWPSVGAVMVIDAVMFSTELDILELRTNELYDVVDKFLIVEGLETFSGKPRISTLVQLESSKFKHVIIPTLEPKYTDIQSGWEREKFLRSQLYVEALKVSSSPDDVLIVSDVDEIPRPEVIKNTISLLTKGMHRFSLDFFYYNVNCYLGISPLGPTIGTMAQYEKEGGSHEARTWGKIHNVVENAGWHFSYFGGLDRIRTKVEGFSHSQDDFCKAFLARSDEEAMKDIQAGQDLFRRAELNKFDHRDENDPKLPKTFLNNKERYKHFIAK